MTPTRCFDVWLLACLLCLGGLGLARGLILRARGVRVVVIERQRSVAQGLTDLAQVISLVYWAYAVVAYAWPLSSRPVPAWLGTVLVDGVWVRTAGAATVLAGLVVYTLALRAFGDSWRLGIDRETPGALVTNGIFAWTRNPIYIALDLFLIGAFLLQGRLVLLLLALINVALFDLLIRREESFLAEAYGQAYRDYCPRVGRYLTWP
jgi:protein-S-isoprenylcysteine O-methyltransferase Ste14